MKQILVAEREAPASRQMAAPSQIGKGKIPAQWLIRSHKIHREKENIHLPRNPKVSLRCPCSRGCAKREASAEVCYAANKAKEMFFSEMPYGLRKLVNSKYLLTPRATTYLSLLYLQISEQLAPVQLIAQYVAPPLRLLPPVTVEGLSAPQE